MPAALVDENKPILAGEAQVASTGGETAKYESAGTPATPLLKGGKRTRRNRRNRNRKSRTAKRCWWKFW